MDNQENNKLIQQEEQAQEPVVQEVVQVDPYLEEAKKYGYKTKEELEAEGKSVKHLKSPQEFVEYGKSYSELQAIRAENAKIKAALEESLSYQRQQAEQAVKQAKYQLEAELQQAKIRGDVVEVEKLVQQKAGIEIKEQQNSIQQRAQQKAIEEAEANAAFIKNNNHWFNDSHPQLQSEAKRIGQEIFLKYPDLSYNDAASMVEHHMNRLYPETRPLDNTPATQISNTKSTYNKASYESTAAGGEERALKSLTPEQRSEYERVKSVMLNPEVKKNYTVEKYLEAFNKYQQ